MRVGGDDGRGRGLSTDTTTDSAGTRPAAAAASSGTASSELCSSLEQEANSIDLSIRGSRLAESGVQHILQQPSKAPVMSVPRTHVFFDD